MAELYDVCVIGAGPAGLASALSMARRGLNVVLVESGSDHPSVATQALSDAIIKTPASHAPMNHAVQRGLGGTSALWGGRCVPLDPIDLLSRPFVERSGWPITSADIAPFYEEACQFLGAGSAQFDVAACRELTSGGQPLAAGLADTQVMRATQLERWSAAPNVWTAHRGQVQRYSSLHVMRDATCLGWAHGGAGTPVSAALVSSNSGGPVRQIAARTHVLAAGGVESTRLVLNSMVAPDGLRVAAPDFIGRFYMGHPSGKLANVQFNGRANETIYGFERDGQTYVRRRITLKQDVLLAEKLLNIAFWLDNPPIADARHRSGVLSAAFLALTSPMLGARLAPAAIRERVTSGFDLARWPHLMNCLRAPISTVAFMANFAYQRYLAQPRIPGFFTYSGSNRYAMHYHAEQAPNEASRIILTGDADALGLRRAQIELSWSDQDVDSILRAHDVLDRELRRLGVGQLEYVYPAADRAEAVRAQAVDGFHQIGTLRMGASPQDGATDSMGRLFGTTNLFVASSATFPTSGQANPTLAMVALALRQAEHIAGVLKAAA